MRAAIALGSNLEPRLDHLRAAARALLPFHHPQEIFLCSRVYETSPVDCPPGSPLFLNAVVDLSPTLSPWELLVRIQAIERSLGRPAIHSRNEPRTVDLDILYYDKLTLDSENLTIPHPRLKERQFVLKPLTDVCPDLKLPGFTASVTELSQALQSSEQITVFAEGLLAE